MKRQKSLLRFSRPLTVGLLTAFVLLGSLAWAQAAGGNPFQPVLDLWNTNVKPYLKPVLTAALVLAVPITVGYIVFKPQQGWGWAGNIVMSIVVGLALIALVNLGLSRINF